MAFPQNLLLLHQGEEALRAKSVELVTGDARLLLHTHMVERAMDLLDMFRQLAAKNDEDLKVVQMLSLRLFNAFASSITLTLSGYNQNSALVMRDILETTFLLDLFSSDPKLIEQWRLADRQARLKHFSPIRVREALDKRDGFTSNKRAQLYQLFSELAGHPSMQSVHMLRPKGMDARNGPFLDPTALNAVLSELGRLAVQVGEVVGTFAPDNWDEGNATLHALNLTKTQWILEFYPPTK